MDINEIILKGKLQHNPELRFSEDGKTPYCNITLTTSRFVDKEKVANSFVAVVLFGDWATRISTGKKGDHVMVTGYIKSGHFDKNGVRIYTSQVVATSAAFTEEKNHYEHSITKREKKMEKELRENVDNIDDLPY